MRKYLAFLVIALAGFTGGFLYPRQATLTSSSATPVHAIRQSGYDFINPLLECEVGSEIESNPELTTLKQRLSTQIDDIYQRGSVTHVALYFRDLGNGPWFGINENDDFTPASLLKTPMMIAYLKSAESDPNILSKRLVYDALSSPPENPTPNIPSMIPSSSYSIEELINRMITYSDNNAFNLLTNNINYDLVKQVHADLGLTIPSESTPQDFISVQAYAGLFRVLYNSSYLSRDMSERALSVLASASYKDGLVAGVDSDTKIAHKYGIRHGNDGVDQLHDCGIVYYPGHPYLICIMTKGHDFVGLTHALKDLSHTVYDEIDTRYRIQ